MGPGGEPGRGGGRGAEKGEEKLGKGGLPAGEAGEKGTAPLDPEESE